MSDYGHAFPTGYASGMHDRALGIVYDGPGMSDPLYAWGYESGMTDTVCTCGHGELEHGRDGCAHVARGPNVSAGCACTVEAPRTDPVRVGRWCDS